MLPFVSPFPCGAAGILLGAQGPVSVSRGGEEVLSAAVAGCVGGSHVAPFVLSLDGLFHILSPLRAEQRWRFHEWSWRDLSECLGMGVEENKGGGIQQVLGCAGTALLIF